MSIAAKEAGARQESDVVLRYLRPHVKFPNMWCPGCGNGVVATSLIRAIDKLGIPRDNIVLVSGIGCSSRMPVYLDFQALHTTHGRALAFATGVKFSRPDLKVIVITGDGDGFSIGGGHVPHAIRRNVDLTYIVMDNQIYGLTTGQVSPTSIKGMKTKTTPHGSVENSINPIPLAIVGGATYVARAFSGKQKHMIELFKGAIQHKGFSLVEVISNCHTYYGRLNRLGQATALLRMFQEKAAVQDKGTNMIGEETKDTITTGIIHRDAEKTELCDEYQKLIDSLAKGKPS